MPCWPDLWREVIGLWRFYLLVLIFALIALMIWAPLIKWLWLRVILRVAGGAAGLFLLVVLGFVALIASKDPRPQYRRVASSTGLHQAILKYQSGWLAMDTTVVMVTSKGCCRHYPVFEYFGASDPSAVKLTWADDSDLR